MDVKRRLARRFLVAVLFASFVRAYGRAAHPALARGRPGSVSLPPPRSRPAERVRMVLRGGGDADQDGPGGDRCDLKVRGDVKPDKPVGLYADTVDIVMEGLDRGRTDDEIVEALSLQFVKHLEFDNASVADDFPTALRRLSQGCPVVSADWICVACNTATKPFALACTGCGRPRSLVEHALPPAHFNISVPNDIASVQLAVGVTAPRLRNDMRAITPAKSLSRHSHPSIYFSLSLNLSRTHSLLSLSPTHTQSRSRSHFLTLSLLPSLPPSLSLPSHYPVSLSLTHTLTLALWVLTISLTNTDRHGAARAAQRLLERGRAVGPRVFNVGDALVAQGPSYRLQYVSPVRGARFSRVPRYLGNDSWCPRVF